MLSTLTGWNPGVQFLCAICVIFGTVWGIIWAGIKLWHKQASKSLEDKFAPYFGNIDDRLTAQDAVLAEVQHEVTINSGKSLKDEVKKVGAQVTEVVEVLTTAPATLLDPYPRLGMIDTQKIQGRALKDLGEVVEQLAEDIKPDNGSTGRDKLNAIAAEQARVSAEKTDDDTTRGHV